MNKKKKIFENKGNNVKLQCQGDLGYYESKGVVSGMY